MFDAINTAGTGLQTYHTWLDTIANNIANVNDTAATNGTVFEQHFVQAQSRGGNGEIGTGVEVSSITSDGSNGDVVHDPTNPLADANGDIRKTNVNLSQQMGDMIAAQRAFQANANVVDTAKTVYQAAIAIGKGI